MSIKKTDVKKIVDNLIVLGILPTGYTGKLTLHFNDGSIAGIQIDTMIRPT